MKKNKSTKTSSKKKISSEELDAKFDKGENVLNHADFDAAVFRVNVDFPAWTVAALDKEALRLGITRQALIKVWITDRIDHNQALRNTGS